MDFIINIVIVDDPEFNQQKKLLRVTIEQADTFLIRQKHIYNQKDQGQLQDGIVQRYNFVFYVLYLQLYYHQHLKTII